ncbi:Lrp/AsnC family transcriptional regulator [Aquimarina spongiae]|uniref:Lrp/AsnC family transcriptional regulator, leucine-responsive regulatory protein n=1 Tax=Aquimarina spongiae TaxID=570521 RepID=A0A1M6KBB9_9FLAO|nr:Lrp/AsnC family transcriptional regulator [Aquimarina spongiae]SHJ56194.1 Lrp/AsnC family transcriptional regulator, leucine-responsive regulatory protein [Aquimarina spongiae]
MKIDAINWEILHCLQENGRLSNAEIGRKIGLSSPAVAERIKKMEDYGILQGFRADVSYTKTGYQLKAMITLKAFMGRLKPFMLKVPEFKEVLNCYRITGNENIIMEVVLRDQLHLQEFIDRLITYGEAKTHIILSNLVENSPIMDHGGEAV